ncbi:MAG: hypothetical protein KF809_04850 [Chloroflexi bacterium]|nr:hypothetical protein [Chloroflexota bacterium]
MTDAPDSTTADPATTSTPHSREQLLRLLRDDPRSVSRAEIKAAFQDGRLGDQDLDIPTLAGMRRISELLTDLQPTTEAATPADRATATTDGTRRTAARSRSDLEGELRALRETVGELEGRLSTTAAGADQAREDLAALVARVERQPTPPSVDADVVANAQRLAAAALAAALLAIVVAVIALVIVLGR